MSHERRDQGSRFWRPGSLGPSMGRRSNLNVEQPSSSSSQQEISAVVAREGPEDDESSSAIFEGVFSLKRSEMTISQQRQSLPVYQYRNEILFAVNKFRVVIIVGETGSGKTTQVPQYLLEDGWCDNVAAMLVSSGSSDETAAATRTQCIACTQPRRVSAISVAKRVSEERGTVLGAQVGYSIQFDNQSDDNLTKIKYMTDGILLREMLLDPLLSQYSVIMVDEAHERSLNTDLLLGLLKKVMNKREDLRVIISSATMDAESFKDFFETNSDRSDTTKDTVCILPIPGRTYPVELFYTREPVANYIESCMETVIQIHQHEDIDGDILVFLTGQEEIHSFISKLKDELEHYPTAPLLVAYPLYAGLPIDQQMSVFEEQGYNVDGTRNGRKVIIATNVAETSVTIPNIRYVVDCGFVKCRVYNPTTESDSLVVTEISKSSSRQRAGRAGRVKAGKCFRMYTEKSFQQLAPNNIPEIQRSDITGVVLQLKALGIDNLINFPFLSPPPANNLLAALELLHVLGVLDEQARLTSPLGMQVAEFPVKPQVAKMLLQSGVVGCSSEMLTIAAMLSTPNIYAMVRGNQQARADIAKQQFAVTEGDHITYLNIYDNFIRTKNQSQWCFDNYLNYKSMKRVVTIRKQLEGYLRKFNIPIKSVHDKEANHDESPTTIICKCVLSGIFKHSARLQPDGSYLTLHSNQKLHIHPSSVLLRKPPKWVAFSEVIVTTKEYMKDVLAIELDWLTEVAPQFYKNIVG